MHRADRSVLDDVNILILDDSEPMQRLIATMVDGWLRGRLYMCRTTHEAFHTLETDEFDIALVDRELWGECGLEFVRTLRMREGAHRHMPIVAMTVEPSRETVLECFLSGANSILAKPLAIRTLANHLRHLLAAQPAFVPFGPYHLPVNTDLAARLGDNPDGWDVVAAIAAPLYRRNPGSTLPTTKAPNQPARGRASDGEDKFALI